MGGINKCASCAKVRLSVPAHILIGFIAIYMVYHVHFAKVLLSFSGANQLAFKKGQCRKAPASTGSELVLHRSSFQIFYDRKVVAAFGLYLYGVPILSCGRRKHK